MCIALAGKQERSNRACSLAEKEYFLRQRKRETSAVVPAYLFRTFDGVGSDLEGGVEDGAGAVVGTVSRLPLVSSPERCGGSGSV